MTTRDDVLAWIERHPGVTPGAIEAALEGLSRTTLNRWIKDFVADGKVATIGAGRSVRHYPSDLKAYFNQPLATRARAAFDPERLSGGLPRFTEAQLRQLRASLPPSLGTAEEKARAVREQLMLELSFASSRLEGNTYDLIDTQVLLDYGRQAAGKSAEEARMILNHRDALRYLLDNLAHARIERRTLVDVHALVSNNLLADPRNEGKIREHAVSIGSSTYTPLDNVFQLGEALDDLMRRISAEEDPFNQSLMLLAGIAYLQPFADCNKRTGRLMANLPLVQAGLPPLSFITVDPERYTRGLLAFYELGNTQIITAAFANGYVASAASYHQQAHLAPRTQEEHQFALKYRAFERDYVRRVVLGEIPYDAPVPDTVPPEDAGELRRHLDRRLRDLHAGHAVQYGLSHEVVDAFLLKAASSLPVR